MQINNTLSFFEAVSGVVGVSEVRKIIMASDSTMMKVIEVFVLAKYVVAFIF